VLSVASMTDYDLRGRVVRSEPAEALGPIVWLESE